MGRPGRREQILEAAADLFADKGYHATTVRDIAEVSGMLSGSLYAHFGSKEDLLFEIVQRAAGQFMAAVEPIARGSGGAGDRLRKAMAAHIQVVADSIAAATVFNHEWQGVSGERRAALEAMRDGYEALLAEIIDQGVSSGEFRPVDRRFARLLVLSAVNWLYVWYKPDGPLRPAEVADKFAELILNGVIKGGDQA